MGRHYVWAPADLVLDGNLGVSAKLVWLVMGQEAPEKAVPLHVRAGIDRRTVQKALARLAATGWIKPPGATSVVTAAVTPSVIPTPVFVRSTTAKRPSVQFSVQYPTALLADSRLSPQARVLYGQLQALGSSRTRSGAFTYPTLSRILGTGPTALREAAAELVKAGWLVLVQESRKTPIQFTLGNPVWADDPVALVRARLKRGGHRGETIMREFLSLLVDSVKYEDDAAPWFQVNPWTGEHLDLDRYYESAKVAFEFQGAQHYEETDFASWNDVLKQVGCDAIKARICQRFRIQLVLVHAEDLSLTGMRAKVGSLLPLRPLTGEDRFVMKMLEDAAEGYRAKSPPIGGR
jgi:hypothetical protein